MAPQKPLPYSDEFKSTDEYIDSLLHFVTGSILFQTLCGGVHILDFFTREPSLYDTVLPQGWREWLVNCDSMDFLDLLMRDNLSLPMPEPRPPTSLIDFIKDIRKHSLCRDFPENGSRPGKLPRHIASGMIPKKIHEVTNFATYTTSLAERIAAESRKEITHFVDFGSGQNYLGRALASPPYDRNIIAVESKELNIKGAKDLDVLAKVAEREKVMRNKKVYRDMVDNNTPEEKLNEKARRRIANKKENERGLETATADTAAIDRADLRPKTELEKTYSTVEGRGSIQYIEHIVNDGDLSGVIPQINRLSTSITTSTSLSSTSSCSSSSISSQEDTKLDPRLMVISIHSCGNLSHHAIRSLTLNPTVQAIAIIGCCYNLLTQSRYPPSYKHPFLRPNLQPLNGAQRPPKHSKTCDPHGYPMSNRLSTYGTLNEGVPLNITARMMAVQAPQNWTEKESDAFFTRHYFRALLQKVFFDYGVVGTVSAEGKLESGTEPVIVGSLKKRCYVSFTAYVREALAKLGGEGEKTVRLPDSLLRMSDAEIEGYERCFGMRKKELSVVWSLMAFAAGVVESLIVVDRYLFLRESEFVKQAWVEAVFDYRLSPRNLVVVGIKK